MTHRLSDLGEALLAAAARAGAEAADVLALSETSISIDVRDGQLEEAQRAEGAEFGLRVLVGRRTAIVATRDARPETFAAVAERAVAMAREAPEDPFAGLADPDAILAEPDFAPLDLADPGEEPRPADLEALALAAEAAARAVPGVTRMDSASAGYGAEEFFLAATNGLRAGYRRTSHSVSAVAISGEGTGMERDWDYDSRTHRADLRDPGEIGRLAGERAVARLGARRPPTGRYPVVYDERVAGSLIGHLLSAISGTAVARGATWARDLLGQPVLPRGLSLLEEPHRPRLGSSRVIDAEGLPTARREIVADGILQGWTLDLASARKLGLPSTANASRSPGGQPSPAVTNIALTQGRASRADLLRDIGTGLLVTSLIGSTINPTTGDYSRGASGFWIEGGEIAFPVNEVTIAGNLREFLPRIIPANDARPHLSRVVPSLLVPELTLAGA